MNKRVQIKEAVLMKIISRMGFFIIMCFMSLLISMEAGATSRTVDEAIAWVNSQVGRSIDYDGVYGAQCVDLIKAYYAYLGVSPVAGNGKDYATNACPAGWQRIQGAVPQRGDILIYGASPNNSYGHVGIYESDYSTYHQNVSGQYVEKITRWSYKGFTNPYWGVLRPNFASPVVVNLPQGCVDRVSGGVGCINVYGWSFDKDATSTALSIHVYIGGPAGSGAECHVISANKLRTDVNNVYGCGNYHGFSDDIYTSLSGSQPVYIYAINVGSGNHNPLLGSTTVNISKDSAKPVIKDVKILNRTSSGYTVQCTVTDNVKVTSVKFPTWTLNNDQDDIIWGEGTGNGNVYTYNVKITDHKGERGLYRTHIYAYDSAGNVEATAVSQEDSPVGTSVVVPTEFTPVTVAVCNEETIFAVFDESIGYEKAKEKCKYFGGHLATIDSESEYKAIKKILAMGGSREHYYMDGKWASGGSGETINNWSVAGFVLEIDEILQPINSGKLGNVTYEVYDDNIPFWVAKAYCDIHDGQLADICSQEVNDYVKNLILTGKQYNYYIGLLKHDGIWYNMKPEETDYINWSPGEPNNAFGIQNCGVIIRNTGKLDDHYAYSEDIGFVMQKVDEQEDCDEVEEPSVTIISTEGRVNNNAIKSNGTVNSTTGYKTKKLGQVKWKTAKNIRKKKVKLSWSVQTDVSGYQIQYARNKKFTKSEKSILKRKNKITIKELRKRKTYYFRVRAYKKCEGEILYGKWSKVKKIKVKK